MKFLLSPRLPRLAAPLLLLLVTMPASAQRVPDNHKMAGGDGKYRDRGVVYKRIDPTTGRAYVGQSWNWDTYRTREAAHNHSLRTRTGNPTLEHRFEVLSRPVQAELDMVEEGFIRKHGLIREVGPEHPDALENKRHQVRLWDEERKIRTSESAEARVKRREGAVDRAASRGLQEERLEEARRRNEQERARLRREHHRVGR